AAATATLAVMGGGTATEGVDFDITTNGNFAAPSKIVTFPSGVHTNQSFTIRIYDDATLDGTENFTLNFTVNPGAGNAVLGNGKPTLGITITDNDFAPVIPGAPANFAVGTFQGTTATQGVLRSDKLKHRSQILFYASELTAAGLTAGNLSALTLRVATKNSTQPYKGLTISIGNTALTTLGGGFVATALTQVYQSNYTSVVGNNVFAFGTGGGSSSTFAWNGTSNIVIQFCFDNEPGTADAAADAMEGTAAPLGAGNRAICYANYISGVASGCTLPAAFISDVRVTATFTEGVAGNPVATTTVTSLSQYLGPNADVYFYTNTGQIMGRIANLTSFDYGCTQINIDRTGATSAQFWNNTTTNYLASKSFRVIPTNNTTTGHYQIYLYYTQAEVNGWQTATTQTLTNAKLVKVSNGAYVPDVTPAAPHLADVSSVNATNAAFGSDYVISGDFSSTGFSGFGVGIPGAASTLPITLLSFDGRKEKNTVKLDWKTASEFNNDHFEIETSKDNNSYYMIGTQKSQGNSTTDQSYSFTDNLPAKGVNYYRLKQIDIDGKSTYSRIISVSFDGKINIVHAYPNPVKDKMVVELASPSSDVTFKVYTLEGKMIRQELHGYVQRSETLNIQNLSSGTYILQVQTGVDIYTVKFVKQ
ncbi:MAG: T9SS type A sorting domain-containing protein, partial [Chitinophagaceae bacterium]